ncbi:MAG: hypothetical protein GEV11_05995 [Streptosporangiales bacterium]|nr:hypothetical protein [Streptosporangiales bacterium]
MADERLGHLERLSDALSERGFGARLYAPGDGPPHLRVHNLAAPMLADWVVCARAQDGTWWFWWPWAQRIAPAEEIDEAADRIARVLAAEEGGGRR